MRAFDSIACHCSLVAPVGRGVALLALLIQILAGADAHSMGRHPALPLIALGGTSLGILAHTVLGYHVLQSGAFSPEERDALWRNYLVGFGYAQCDS